MTIHVFATIMALYPITKTEEIAEEFGISVSKLRRMARICRVKKDRSVYRDVYLANARKGTETTVRRRRRREQSALKLWKEGKSMGEIAKKLKVERCTVYKYLLNVRKKGVKLNRQS